MLEQDIMSNHLHYEHTDLHLYTNNYINYILIYISITVNYIPLVVPK